MTEYKFDEDFDGFLEDFGVPHDTQSVSEDVVDSYRYKLPEQLFVYWRELGFCGFQSGLIWMVNPTEYQDLLDSWLEGTQFESRNDLSVIARSAFGELEVWAKGKKQVMAINPNINVIYFYPEADKQENSNLQEDCNMRRFWGYQDIEFIDKKDAAKSPLFFRALKKLGQLKSDEMYGFSHRLALGGKETLENLEIVKLDVYHDLAQQMEPPQIIKV